MFRGRAANPCSNKFLYQKDIEHRQKLHRANLKKMKPAIDNSSPKKPGHLTNNKKREKMMEDRFVRIERENRLLLEKMSHIMSKPSLDNSNESMTYTKSLNKSFRKRELQRITAENQNILRRIQQREPYYNHIEWEEDRKTRERYIRNICEFPVNRSGNNNGKGGRRRRQGSSGEDGSQAGGMGHSRSGMIPSMDPEYTLQSNERISKNNRSSSDFKKRGNKSSSRGSNTLPSLDF